MRCTVFESIEDLYLSFQSIEQLLLDPYLDRLD